MTPTGCSLRTSFVCVVLQSDYTWYRLGRIPLNNRLLSHVLGRFSAMCVTQSILDFI